MTSRSMPRLRHDDADTYVAQADNCDRRESNRQSSYSEGTPRRTTSAALSTLHGGLTLLIYAAVIL